LQWEDKVTREDLQSELEQPPFIPFRLHLVSGKTIDVSGAGEGWMLRRSILITRRRQHREPSYNVIALINIERIERLDQASTRSSR
jgi:hypothetical protein